MLSNSPAKSDVNRWPKRAGSYTHRKQGSKECFTRIVNVEVEFKLNAFRRVPLKASLCCLFGQQVALP